MRTTHFLGALLTVMVGVLAWKTTEEPTREIRICMDDWTGQARTVPEVLDIRDRFDIRDDYWKASTFIYRPITDAKHNGEVTIALEAKRWYMVSVEDRQKEMQVFNRSFDTLQAFISGIMSERNKSEVYLPFARMLNELNSIQADVKELEIYSDFLENSKAISFYDSTMKRLLIENPDSIYALLQAQYPLADLTGITVRLYFNEKELAKHGLYDAVTNMYVEMLRKHHATVEILNFPNTGVIEQTP
jgi:hypothetical protein